MSLTPSEMDALLHPDRKPLPRLFTVPGPPPANPTELDKAPWLEVLDVEEWEELNNE